MDDKQMKGKMQELSQLFDELAEMEAKNPSAFGLQSVHSEHRKAFSLLRLNADKLNYADSQYSLGCLYEEGEIVQQNYEQAEFYFEKAAEQGHEDAQYKLACMCTDGINIPPDYAKATSLFRKLAGHNEELQQSYLRTNPFGYAPVDLAQMAVWYRRMFQLHILAQQGYVEAQYELSHMFLDDIPGIPQNPNASISLLEMAAAQGHILAKQELWEHKLARDSMRRMFGSKQTK